MPIDSGSSPCGSPCRAASVNFLDMDYDGYPDIEAGCQVRGRAAAHVRLATCAAGNATRASGLVASARAPARPEKCAACSPLHPAPAGRTPSTL